jgi:hypothetical protein
MTSKFLLHLSSDSIDLDRADASGQWHRLGSIAPDSENLAEAFTHLRQTAMPDAAAPLDALIALPTDQIKLLDLDHSDTSEAALQQALAGQTPYECNQLCVDCHPTPQGQTIAAIAQETLDEADRLAAAFGFNAVGFVALPGGSWGNNFAIFQPSGSAAQSRPSAFIAAAPAPKPPMATPVPAAASPAPELRARPDDPAAPIPQISTNAQMAATPTLNLDMTAPQVIDIRAMPHETLPTASTKTQARLPLVIAQRLTRILKSLRPPPRAPKSAPAPITTIQAQVGGKPKYLGLILTTLLLLFMFTVAALAATLGRDRISAWLGLSPSQTEVAAGLPAAPIGQAIEISLQPLNTPPAPAEQAARLPQATDEALQLQRAEVALKDPESDAEPAIALAAQEPLEVRALTIGPAAEPVTAPSTDSKGLSAAREPKLQNSGAAPLLDMPWLTPDPLPDKEDPRPNIAQDQSEAPSAANLTALADRANIAPITAALEQSNASPALLPPDDASPEEADPLAAFRPRLRPAKLSPPVRLTTLPEGQSLARTLRPRARPRAIELAALLPAPVVAKPSEIQAPTATSRKTVTRAATRTNVIDLRDVNLIGITGTTRLRNALVRLPNGQVVKVRIGDRLDGGRVTDISSNSLTYAKSGRSITLDMPRG